MMEIPRTVGSSSELLGRIAARWWPPKRFQGLRLDFGLLAFFLILVFNVDGQSSSFSLFDVAPGGSRVAWLAGAGDSV